MTFEIFLVLALLAGAMAFFTFEWLPIDVVTLSLLVALVVSGILSPEEAFAGFANEIIIVLGSVFVLSGALVKTGVMDWLGQAIFRLAGSSRTRVLLVVTTLSASMSALVSNTNSTAVLMPAAFELAKKGRFSPSRLLMPLAFASILGGTCTLIGTSTNIAASGMLKKLGYAPYGFFEFTAVGLVIVVTGILYLAFVGYRLLPARPAASLSEKYDIGAYLSAVVVAEGSSLDGKALRDAGLADLGMHVAAIKRDGRRFFPRRDTILRAGDLLVVEATRESLLATKESADLHLETDSVLGDADLETEGAKLVEAFVAPSSDIADRTLSEIGFRSRFRVAVLALYRRGHARPTDLRHLPLRVGDVLLLQGSEGDLDSLHKSGDLWLLDEVAHVPFRRRRGLFAAAA
ncbi:MAG: SLC13 family permease, partial [Acidobacteriota bacterium]|nr:SLC13 family permease [Acidobacteriota bacterium]